MSKRTLRCFYFFLLNIVICRVVYSSPLPDSAHVAGFRASQILSIYPNNQFPEAKYWASVAKQMSAQFPSYRPAGIWIVSLYLSEPKGYTWLNFPSPGGNYPWMYFEDNDQNEAYLTHFDTTGVSVWLQVEPGGADIDTLIDIVLHRYKHHPCVIGFGIDVEWYQTHRYSGGKKVSDSEAERWERKVKSIDPSYSLFLKHYGSSWMPVRYRGDIVFIDDSQDFSWSGNPLNAMVEEFRIWGNKFQPNRVGFQFGYAADRSWWSRFADPAKTIGDALSTAVTNCHGLFWVDFTILEVFPVLNVEPALPAPETFTLYQNYPNPFHLSTTIHVVLQHTADSKIEVFDELGKRIVSYQMDHLSAGVHRFRFDGKRLPAGIYYYRLISEGRQQVRKMILIK